MGGRCINGGKDLFCMDNDDCSHTGRGEAAALCFCFIARKAFENFLYFHFISLEKFYFKLWGEMCHILKSCSHLPTVIIFSRCLEISKNSKHLASSPRIPPSQGCVVFGALRNPPAVTNSSGEILTLSQSQRSGSRESEAAPPGWWPLGRYAGAR